MQSLTALHFNTLCRTSCDCRAMWIVEVRSFY